MNSASKRYAERYETLFLGGKKLWDTMKKKPETKKKIYFIGTNGNSGAEFAESLMDALAYIPAPDGTKFIHRRPGESYPVIEYGLAVTDKLLSSESKISPTDLYVEDEEKYRDLESKILKEFAETPLGDTPMACVVGEGALLRQSNIDLIKETGVIIWLDADPVYTWGKTQLSQQTTGGIWMPPNDQERPPVWAIANGWDGDVDDVEGKAEYLEIIGERRKVYEEVADIRLRVDVPGLAENSYWGAERLLKLLNEHFGLVAGEASVEEEVMEKDLEKFLEGARLSKYLEAALKWCDEQGAASIEDVVENVPELSEALSLKPLERKRLEKAAAVVAG